MELIPEGKNFRLVQDSELPKILDYLEQFLPESLKFHQTIKTYLKDRVWQFYFYVAKNWPDEPVCLHFPGCTLTPNDNIYESFGIFCPMEKIECVDLMKDEDILIDWKKPLYLNFTHKGIMDRLNLFYSGNGAMNSLAGDIYVYNKSAEDLEIEDLPSDEVELRPLAVENVNTIYDLYPANEIECVELFKKLVNILPGVGIFRKDTDELAAWMVHSYYGAMFSMQTLPEFRRKGYGIYLAKALTKLVMDRGYHPFVVIRPENDASRNLYKKLGFEKAFETMRATLSPFEENGKCKDVEHTEDIKEIIFKNCENIDLMYKKRDGEDEDN